MNTEHDNGTKTNTQPISPTSTEADTRAELNTVRHRARNLADRAIEKMKAELAAYKAEHGHDKPLPRVR